MSQPFDLARWRPAPLLPERDARDPALIFVIATLCFLACLTAIGVIAADRAARGWSNQLTGEATVIVRARDGESPDAAAARATEALAGLPGVTEARALEREKAYDLIRPWLGDIAELDDLPVPRLVAVSLAKQSPPSADAMQQALDQSGIDAVVDDHSLWLEDIQRAANTARALGAGVFLVIAMAAGAVVAFATRAGMTARRDVVEVLHLAGAGDSYIAQLFQLRFAQVAALGGAAGAVAAALVGAVLRLIGGGDGITPALPVAWSDLFAILPCPLLAAGVAALAARITATRLIRGLQ